MLEEGGHHATADFNGGIADLIDRLYRDGGVSPVLGRPNIPFAEGRCVGGTTVINGGVHWRTPQRVLARWTHEFGLPELDEATLAPHFDIFTKDLGIKIHSETDANQASTLLARGSEKLGWRWSDVPRAQKGCLNSNRCPTGCPNGAKQSMLVSYIPDAVRRGARLITDAKAGQILFKNGTANGVAAILSGPDGRTRPLTIHAQTIFVCAGAMQTPLLLRRSGIKHQVGYGLHLHLNLKAVALFPHDIDPAAATIVSKQVKEFEDRDIFIASSTFDPVYLALALAPHGQAAVENVMAQWRQSGIFVAQLKAEATGRVHVLPGMNRPFPVYRLTNGDLANIRFAIEKLGDVLLASGARQVYLPVAGSGRVSRQADVTAIAQGHIDPRALDLVSVHAMASCRLGRALDPYGGVKGVQGLYVNDASMLPDATGVSPQMTIMAVTRRNLTRFLENHA
jgi:choline dehydrogenase-like flavoprotein